MKPFTQYIHTLFDSIAPALPEYHNSYIKSLRQKGLKRFSTLELPHNRLETWRHHAIDQCVQSSYTIQQTAKPYRPVEDYFHCKIGQINSEMFSFLNGWYVNRNAPLTIFANGMIVGTIFSALQQFPDLVQPYLAQKQEKESDGLLALNQAFFNDGIFIYIPDNLNIKNPIQMVSLVEGKENLMINNRNLIVVGQNSKLSIIHCDDSLSFTQSLLNNVTEIYLAENATLNYYKMENKDPDSLLINNVLVQQKRGSSFISHAITFNAGYVRNQIEVDLTEPFATARLYGLYLVDKKQYVDNQVKVNHLAPDCTSTQLYKGIVDDEAQANFNGHVVVHPQAQHTMAYQSNRNIALTDEVKITTKPFLEIYADDVKCSHGSTVGQLDDDALFYMRTRGLCERSAKVLLMYAFATEAVNHVEIAILRESLTMMIQKRLSGDLTMCNQCSTPCPGNNRPLSFDIDLSKI
ncbi:MAG: Fe-S cluster assembly protein SufD [Bacteroidales bacterium]|jgi:Fe-S cluster assembly protein SufD|nr:Fe-S cluster assembly protein SufD [Bacteroidales bacterium]